MAMKVRSSTNTFIDTIIRKFDQQSRNYCLVNPNLASKPIIYCNDGFCELTGHPRSEILQKPGWCEFLAGPLTSSMAKQRFRESLNDTEESHIELLFYKKNGNRFICSIVVAPVRAECAELILLLLSFEDITSKQEGLMGAKTAGFQWPSSLTGALNRVVGRGQRGIQSTANLSDIVTGSSTGLRTQEGISQLPVRATGQSGASARRQSILLAFGFQHSQAQLSVPSHEHLSRSSSSHLAPYLPGPVNIASVDLVTGGSGDLGTCVLPETSAQAPTTTIAAAERVAVSIAAVSGEVEAAAETGELYGAGTVASQLPPHYGRVMDRLVNLKDRAFQRIVGWISAESHPDHKLHSGRIPRFTILHYSPFKAIWDWLILFFVLYTAIFTPYSAAFLLQNEHGSANVGDSSYSATPSFEIFNIVEFIVDVMFLTDIVINFRTTYVNKADEVVSAPSKIAIHYLKGMFLIDAVAAIPFDLLLFGSKSDETTTLVGLLKTVRLMRLIRVARKWKKVSEYGAAVLILLMATFTLIAHWMACIWYAIASVERPYLPEPKIGWLDDLSRQTRQFYSANDTDSGPTIKSKYVTALMFTFSSLTSVGFGNIAPNTTSEKIFGIVLMLIGSMMYATIFGNVSAIIQRLYSGTQRYHMEMGKVKEFIKFHQIPHPLRQRLEEYFQHAWKYTNGIDMNVVLRSFPECLQADICLHLNRNLLDSCPSFQNASPGCLRQLSMKFRSSHVPPGDILVHRGDVLDALYFISRGSVEIIRDNIVLAILGKDDIFGEDPVRFKYVGKSSANVRALTYCDLHKIVREDLLDTFEMYPEFAENFAKHLQITFDLRDEHLAVTHGPSSESSVTSEEDFSGYSGPRDSAATVPGDMLDDLPAIRIRRRRLYGSSKRRRSSMRHFELSPSKAKAAELRPSVRRIEEVDDVDEDEDTNQAFKPRTSVGGGIFEMRPDKAGLDITPANYDFPEHREEDLSAITGAISSWAGGRQKPSHTSDEADEHQSLLAPDSQLLGARRTSTRSTSTQSSAVSGRAHSPPRHYRQPTGHSLNLKTGSPWQYDERDYLSRDMPERSTAAVSSSAAGCITSSATLPEFGSHTGDVTTVRSTPAEERSLAVIADTGMRLTTMATQQEKRVSVITERISAIESRVASDLMGILSMLRHKQQQEHEQKPSTSGSGTLKGKLKSTAVHRPTASTVEEPAVPPVIVLHGITTTTASSTTIIRQPLRRDSSESDSQLQWPPPPSTEEASLNLSMGLSSDDTLPSGSEASSPASSPDNGPVTFI